MRLLSRVRTPAYICRRGGLGRGDGGRDGGGMGGCGGTLNSASPQASARAKFSTELVSWAL